MARLISIAIIIGIALICVLAEEEFYSDQYDNINMTEILTNNKLRKQYYNCMLSVAPCKTGDARFFKTVFFDALRTQCKRCTEKQKLIMDEVVDWFTKNSPEEWQALVAKSLQNIQIKTQ